MPVAPSCRRESKKKKDTHMRMNEFERFVYLLFIPAGCNEDLDDYRKEDDVLRSPSSPIPCDQTGVELLGTY